MIELAPELQQAIASAQSAEDVQYAITEAGQVQAINYALALLKSAEAENYTAIEALLAEKSDAIVTFLTQGRRPPTEVDKVYRLALQDMQLQQLLKAYSLWPWPTLRRR